MTRPDHLPPRLTEPVRVAVVGGGPAGLMAAETAALGGAAVTVYERMPSVGRKFLLAGRGGLNITHGEPLDRFLTRYGAAEPRLRPVLERWTPDDLRAWCEALGQPTTVGTSGRVFPAGWKASPLLRAWLRRLAGLGVTLHARHRWIGWDEAGRPLVQSASGPMVVEADAVVLALGGASWPQLGSDGAWTDPFQRADIAVAPLRPANCGFIAPWSGVFRDRFEGQPLKNIALDFAGHVARGEVVVTRSGLEGGALYALASSLRPALDRQGAAIVHLSLRPDLAEADVAARLSGRRAKQSLATALRKTLRLAPVAIGLLREVEPALPQSLAAHDPAALAALITPSRCASRRRCRSVGRSPPRAAWISPCSTPP